MVDNLYLAYKTYIATIDDIHTSRFRRHLAYVDMLEHVSVHLGTAYAALIKQEFPHVDVTGYVALNDAVGDPQKARIGGMECAPTSLRYAYQALKILTHFRSGSIVEVGCGYGGLFLAIDYFAKLMGKTIDKYNIVDLPEAGRLIGKYLGCHKISVPYVIHDAGLYGSTVEDAADLFLISNYCFTEIHESHRVQYAAKLLSRVNHGFITWQTNSVPLDRTSVYLPRGVDCRIQEENPQTSGNKKNYYVTF